MIRLRTPQAQWNLKQSGQEIAGWAQLLAAQGLQPGAVVVLSGPLQPAYLFALLACWQQQLITLPLHPGLPSTEVAAIIRQVSARLVIAEQALPEAKCQQLSWRAGGSHQATQPLLTSDFVKHQPMTLIRTSGSSGRPKLALHHWQQHQASALGSLQHLPLQAESRWLLNLPLYHVGGLAIVMRCLLAEAEISLPDPQATELQNLKALQPSHYSLVATQLYRWLKQPELIPALRKARALLLGGSAIPENLISEAFELELPVHTSYGSTEMSSQICSTPAGASRQELASSGTLLPYRELRIADSGEIEVRGQTLFQGYLQPEGLVLPLNAEGWFSTGDLGHLDASGFLYVQGRRDRLIISGGENIQPEEIERYMLGCEGVQQVAVVPLADPEFGQVPVAFVAAESFAPLKWQAVLRAHLPGYKIPKQFWPWTAPPEMTKPQFQYFLKLAEMLNRRKKT